MHPASKREIKDMPRVKVRPHPFISQQALRTHGVSDYSGHGEYTNGGTETRL